MIDWNDYDNFTSDEFKCHETGECMMDPHFMQTLQSIRDVFGKPMIVSSGYRSTRHSAEQGKVSLGEHTKGLAADILVTGSDALDLVYISLIHGISRVGISQKGEGRFVHLGVGDQHFNFLPRGIWSY